MLRLPSPVPLRFATFSTSATELAPRDFCTTATLTIWSQLEGQRSSANVGKVRAPRGLEFREEFGVSEFEDDRGAEEKGNGAKMVLVDSGFVWGRWAE